MASARKEKYGKVWPEGWGDIHIELFMFASGYQKLVQSPGRYDHFVKITKMLFPWNPKKKTGYCHHPWAERMARAACKYNYVSISGPTSSGKSEFSAMWAYVNWLCAMDRTMVLITSTDIQSARLRVWGSLEKFLATTVVPTGKTRRTPAMHSMGEDDRNGIILLPSAAKYAQDAAAKLIGLKNQRVILICDELPEISHAVPRAAFDNLSGNPNFSMIGLGNFKSYYDPFGTFSEPRGGWASIDMDSLEWDTKRGVCVRIDGLEAIKINPDGQYPVLTGEKVEAHIAAEGENSLSTWRFIRSFPAPQGDTDYVVTEPDLARNKALEPAVFDGPTKLVCGVDPSFTAGGDRCTGVILTVGTVDGLPTLSIKDVFYAGINLRDKEVPPNYQRVNAIGAICDKYGIPAERTGVDATGGGIPFHEIMCQQWKAGVLAVPFGGKASDLMSRVGSKKRGFEAYGNRVTEVWFNISEFIRAGQIRGITPELALELTSRKYEGCSGGRVIIESKTDYKLRSNGRSPDIADALAVAIAVCRERLGITPAGFEKDRERMSGRGGSIFGNGFGIRAGGHGERGLGPTPVKMLGGNSGVSWSGTSLKSR